MVQLFIKIHYLSTEILLLGWKKRVAYRWSIRDHFRSHISHNQPIILKIGLEAKALITAIFELMPRVIPYFISLFVHMERNNMTALSTTIVKNYLIQ